MISALPMADEITRQSSLVDYASNLAGEETLEAGLSDWSNPSANVVGAMANALIGMMVLPDLLRQRGYRGPVSSGTVLLSAVLGGLAGYYYPATTTVVQGYLLINENM